MPTSVVAPARAERRLLCECLEALGPDAPTLDDGWTTHDLAAHLWVREGRLRGLPGLVVPALHGVTRRAEAEAKGSVPFAHLVADLRAGPPLGPVGVPGLRDRANLHEFFVHHEDVRRANGLGPRPADETADLDDAIWAVLPLWGPLLARRAPVGVVLVGADGRRRRIRRPPAGGAAVEVHGRAGEILLDLFGRRGVADVTYLGPPAAVEGHRSARLGL